MKKLKLYLIMLFLFISLVGCAEQKLLEQVGLTTLVGYDLGSEENIATTAVIRQVNPEFQSNVEILTAENQTSKGTRSKINRMTSKKIVAGQLRVALFGDEIAKDGIGNIINAFSRDPSISGSVYMAVVEGQAKPLLDYQYENIDDIGQHIFKVLEQNIQGEQVISTTLHEVAHDYHSIGRDIAIPIINRKEEAIEISGLALFKRGKMVGNLPAEDSFYLKLIRGHFNSGSFEINIGTDGLESSLMTDPSDEMSIVLDTIKSKNDIKLINQKTPEFNLLITLNARLLEINSDIDLGKPKNAAKLEKAISENLSSEISRVISSCQEVNSDVFGFGEHYRSSVRHSNLTSEKWYELYENVKVNVEVDFTILRSGTEE